MSKIAQVANAVVRANAYAGFTIRGLGGVMEIAAPGSTKPHVFTYNKKDGTIGHDVKGQTSFKDRLVGEFDRVAKAKAEAKKAADEAAKDAMWAKARKAQAEQNKTA